MSLFNKKIISFSNDVAGLNIGDASVKIVQINDGVIQSFNAESLPVGVVVDGEIIDKEKLSQVVRSVIKNAQPKKIKTKKVRCSLPESKSFLRLISMPPLNEKEMKEAIKWEIEANIPLSLDQVYYDWQVVEDAFGGSKEKTRVLVLAASKKVVNRLLQVVDDAGLETVGIESESIALNRGLLEANNEKTVLTVHLGKTMTSFIFSVMNVSCFTASVPISEQTVINEISKKLNISDDKTKQFIRKKGLSSFFKDEEIFALLIPVLDNIVDEIEKTVDFYLEGLKYSKKIDKIIICGKLSGINGLIPYFSKKLKMKVEVGNISIGLNKKKTLPIIERENSLRYSTAIGLAMGYDS